MGAAAVDEVGDMSAGKAYVGGAPAGNITHQYATKISLGEADLYKRRMEEMKKGTTASTNLKMAPPPLNKGRSGIDQAPFRVGDWSPAVPIHDKTSKSCRCGQTDGCGEQSRYSQSQNPNHRCLEEELETE